MPNIEVVSFSVSRRTATRPEHNGIEEAATSETMPKEVVVSFPVSWRTAAGPEHNVIEEAATS